MLSTSNLKVLLAVIAASLAVGGAVWYLAGAQTPQRYVACTMEAKLCSDGSAVGRTGPDCEFAACPTPVAPPSSFDCSGSGDSCPSGYTCIQKCGPPVARMDDPPPGYYCERDEIASQPRMCPICLASNTMIDAPDGPIGVKDVKVGTIVWSVDRQGERIASEVIRASRSQVPATHRVVHLVMTDGREVWVSPDHPTADGRRVAELRVGDAYENGTVAAAGTVPYWDTATYDLLPASNTGTYWANGILLGSTLAAPSPP